MNTRLFSKSLLLFIVSGLFYMDTLKAQTDSAPKQPMPVHNGNMVILFIVVAVMLVATIILKILTSKVLAKVKRKKEGGVEARWNQYINNMDSKQIEELIEYKQNKKTQDKSSGSGFSPMLLSFFLLSLFLFFNQSLFAQSGEKPAVSALERIIYHE